MSETPSIESVSDGLIITIFEDHGPDNIYNSSPLTDDEAFNMAIKGMTAIGTDSPLAKGELRSYGPMPTPRDPYLTLGFLFSLKAKESEDYRISTFGRIVVIWVITKSSAALKYIGLYKQMIRRIIRTYQIKFDNDIKKEEILHKIDEKIRIIETGVESYYISQQDALESFYNLALVPSKAPIMLVDNNKRQINILLREKPALGRKMQLKQIANEFKAKIPKGSLYKTEIISDDVTIQHMLSKEGLLAPTDISDHFRIRLTDKLTFEELDDFLELQLNPIRNKLATLILQAYETKKVTLFSDLSAQTGFSEVLIESFVNGLIKANIIQNTKIDKNSVIFN